jgi:hypothetical protein
VYVRAHEAVLVPERGGLRLICRCGYGQAVPAPKTATLEPVRV